MIALRGMSEVVAVMYVVGNGRGGRPVEMDVLCVMLIS